ncbi:MAG: hypothetical protein AAGH68_10730, partial [Pseudomonadota bacterium]
TAGYTNPIRLAWFDTKAQEAREISLSAQRIAYAGGAQEVRAEPDDVTLVGEPRDSGEWNLPALPGFALPIGGVLGLCMGLALVLRDRNATWAIPEWLRTDPLRRDLRAAARSGNSMGVRNAAHSMAERDGIEIPEKLVLLDRSLFGEGKPQPDLMKVARSVLQRRRRTRPLDGL